MRGPTVLVFVLIVATAGLVATVWEFQVKGSLLGRDPEPFAHKVENVGVATSLVAVSLIIPFWLVGGADEDRRELIDSLRSAARMFEHSSDGVMLADRDGMVRAINPAFTQLTGYQGQEALGCNMWLLLSAEQEGEFAKLMWASVKSRGDWRGEILVKGKRGQQFPVMYTFSVVHNESGATAGYVALLAHPGGTHRPDENTTVRAQDDSAPGSQFLAT